MVVVVEGHFLIVSSQVLYLQLLMFKILIMQRSKIHRCHLTTINKAAAIKNTCTTKNKVHKQKMSQETVQFNIQTMKMDKQRLPLTIALDLILIDTDRQLKIRIKVIIRIYHNNLLKNITSNFFKCKTQNSSKTKMINNQLESQVSILFNNNNRINLLKRIINNSSYLVTIIQYYLITALNPHIHSTFLIKTLKIIQRFLQELLHPAKTLNKIFRHQISQMLMRLEDI